MIWDANLLLRVDMMVVLAWELACLCICVLGCLCWLCYGLCELCVLIMVCYSIFGAAFLLSQVMLDIYRLSSLSCVSWVWGKV